MSRTRRQLLGGAVLGAWLLHAASKLGSSHLSEMLWACHVASLAIGIGLWLDQRRLVAAGTLFHLAVGFPAFVIDLALTRSATPSSLLLHVLPPVAGYWLLRQARWPRYTASMALGAYLGLVLLCRWFTEPALNINLAFAPYAPLASPLNGNGTSIIGAGLVLLALGLGRFLIERRLSRKQATE